MQGGSWHGVACIYLIPLRQEILSSQVETALARDGKAYISVPQQEILLAQGRGLRYESSD